MELYFAPMACSLATRIALYETGQTATFVCVDRMEGKLEDGSDYHRVNPMGQVPALRTDSGELLTETSAILQYVADLDPEGRLAARSGPARYRLQRWLNFITSELHKALFYPQFSPASNDGAKAFARDLLEKRFDYLERHLTGREFLLDRFTVADAYLATVLGWTRPVGIDLGRWPALKDYFDRMRARPAVATAVAEEYALYEAHEARKGAA
ncbi:glutathione binding-like protein [Microbaculum marinum]|uniref:Glutathione binding-like protein n=1 Tax=Microbaculum marinum TaxID=1764581 RepID=A0AAW9RKF4_9HYPH